MTAPSGPISSWWRAGILPLEARAKQIMPGIMKMKTGRSFRKAAAIELRRASFSFGAPSARWTMY